MSNPHPNAHASAGVYTNAAEVAAVFVATGRRAAQVAFAKTRHASALLEAKIKAKASGRPGPRAVTGDYRRSWTHEVRLTSDGAIGRVGTNKPQARRLEYGFVGADRIGRVYNQPPYPHVGPAVDELRPVFLADMLEVGRWST